MSCAHCPTDPRIRPSTAGRVVDDRVDTVLDVCSYHLREYRRRGYDVEDVEHVTVPRSRLEELHGAIRDATATCRGEAAEITARDDVDEHLRDVADGLELTADELEDTLERADHLSDE